MPVALPKYETLRDVSGASPGHRFRIYFAGWTETWEPDRTGKKDAVESVVSLTKEHMDMLLAAKDRQLGLALDRGESALIRAGTTEAPFVTGMGMEHPLENGFAFLDPYGLPYLPGSSVKGVLRRAAEEVALFDPESSSWSLLDVWWLFGFDENSAFFQDRKNADPELLAAEKERWREAYNQAAARQDMESVKRFINATLPRDESGKWAESAGEFLPRLLTDKPLRRRVHLRGSLSFWDVFPEPPERKLRVEIMNPHYSHYYQDGEPPGDWGDPNPIFFLAMPAGTKFRFVLCLTPVATLPEKYRNQWKELMLAAMEHAFSWLGFGAKTSLGYGMMREDPDDARYRAEIVERERILEVKQQERRQEEERERMYESLPEFDKLLYKLEHQADEQFVNQTYRTELETRSGDEQKRLAAALKQAYIRHGKWQGKQSQKQKDKNTRLVKILGEA